MWWTALFPLPGPAPAGAAQRGIAMIAITTSSSIRVKPAILPGRLPPELLEEFMIGYLPSLIKPQGIASLAKTLKARAPFCSIARIHRPCRTRSRCEMTCSLSNCAFLGIWDLAIDHSNFQLHSNFELSELSLWSLSLFRFDQRFVNNRRLAEKNFRPQSVSSVLSALFFCSGSLALIYEVIWQRGFALVFGSSGPATAAVLASYFAGLGLGSQVIGSRTARLKRPLLAYSILELFIGLGALLVPLILLVFEKGYPWLFAHFGESPFYSR